jgi:hypothetical protein
VLRLSYCQQVVEGVAHVYPRLAPTCEWDTAAAHAIVEEAGGCVLQAGLCDSKGKLLEDWKVGWHAIAVCTCWHRHHLICTAGPTALVTGSFGKADSGAVQQGDRA